MRGCRLAGRWPASASDASRLEALATPGQRDAFGREQVIWSAARLWLDRPIAMVTECFYREFLDAYPGPWTVPFPGARIAQ